MSLYCSHHFYSLTHCTSFHSPHFSEAALGKVTMEHDMDNSVTTLLPVLSFFYPSIAAPSAQFIQAETTGPYLTLTSFLLQVAHSVSRISIA